MLYRKFGFNIVVLMLIGSSFSFSGSRSQIQGVDDTEFEMVELQANDAFTDSFSDYYTEH